MKCTMKCDVEDGESGEIAKTGEVYEVIRRVGYTVIVKKPWPKRSIKQFEANGYIKDEFTVFIEDCELEG